MSESKVNNISIKDSSDTYAENKGAMIGFADTAGSKYVSFKAFIDKFSFSQEQQTGVIKNDAEGVDLALFGGGIKHRKYSISLVVPSHSIEEARANLAKFQLLCRFGIKKSESLTLNNAKTVSLDGDAGILHAYFQNLISTPHTVSSDALSSSKIKNNGVKCFIPKLELSAEMDAGFFEFYGFIAPKAYKISFDLEIADLETSKHGKVPISSSKLGFGDKSNYPFGIEYTTSRTTTTKPQTLLSEGETLDFEEYCAIKFGSKWNDSYGVTGNTKGSKYGGKVTKKEITEAEKEFENRSKE
jgi:hypothetical protein